MKNAKKNRSNTVIERYVIRPTERIEILWKSITKGRDSWDFYDFKYGDVIITGCRIVEGKSGKFLGMPAKEQDGTWYPVVFLNHSLGDKLIEYIEDADENDDWEEVDSNEILSFNANDKADNETGKGNKGKKD